MNTILYDRCQRCGKNSIDTKIEINHIKPKYLGGTDKNGRIFLCKECHNLFHKELDKIVNSISELIKRYDSKVEL